MLFYLLPVGSPVPPDDEDIEDEIPQGEGAEETKAGAVEAEEEETFEDQNVRYRLPDPALREMFAIADQLLGASKLIVMCEDGKSRMARIPGKMKRRMWIKPGDLLIVQPWDFLDEKADVKYRYIRTQSANLSRRGLIPELLDVGF